MYDRRSNEKPTISFGDNIGATGMFMDLFIGSHENEQYRSILGRNFDRVYIQTT